MLSQAPSHPIQGRHPFVYALAEFVDNSLRATRRNGSRPRSITISLVGCRGRVGGLALLLLLWVAGFEACIHFD